MAQDSQEEVSPKRAALYVDGFNLYHSIKDLNQPFLKWCDLWRLGEVLIPKRSERLVRVAYCTAYYPSDRGKRVRHESYVDALSIKGVETILGHFIREPVECYNCDDIREKPTEKESDINLALAVFDDAVQDVVDTAYLLTADTDQAATAALFKRRFPGKRLVTVSPPGRKHSQHLLRHADAKIALGPDHIERALLQGMVTAKDGRLVRRPPEYDPPDGYIRWDDRPSQGNGHVAKVTDR